MGGGQGQSSVGSLSKDILSERDLQIMLRDQQEELERERKRRIAWAYFFIMYIMKEQDKAIEQYQKFFDKTFNHEFPVASERTIKSLTAHVQSLHVILDVYEKFDKTFHLDHTDIKGIEFQENIKTFMTPEEKQKLGKFYFDQRMLNTVFYAVKLGDNKAGREIAKDAIEQFTQGNGKPLGNIIGRAIRKNMEEVHKVKNMEEFAAATATLQELLTLVERHPDLKPDCKLTEKEMTQAYGDVTKGFLFTMGMQSKIVLETLKVTGEKLPKEYEEEYIKNVIMGDVIAKTMSSEQLGNFGFTIEHITQGILPKQFMKHVETTRKTFDIKELDSLLEAPVLLPEEDQKEIEKYNPVLERELKQLEHPEPVLGGFNVPHN